ncbi:MAG: glycosyltransferase family 4 protein [Victivallales bacterium]|nr:glycosyltransferase family 4 protein [Victivallales bacterium]
MHIGFIEDTALRGGTQIWVSEAVVDFIKKGHEITVIAPDASFVAENARAAGAQVFTYNYNDITVNQDKYQALWTEGLRNCEVAVTTVHPPRDGFHCAVFAGKCIKAAGLKTILVPKTGSIVPWYKREYYQPDPDVNARVICITNFTRQYLIDVYKIPSEKIELVYQGTEVDRFTSTPETRAEALKHYPLRPGAAPVIASVGAMEPRKGQIILLQAVKRLLDSGKLPNIHVMFVGEGPDEAMLKAVTAAYALEEHVSFFPFTNEPNYVFERMDMLAFPSLYKEGLPNVLLEAMSMKVPVIATNMTGIPEVVFNGETGYLTDPGNVEQFSDAMEKVWSSPQMCAEMGEKARKLMQDKMDKKNQFDAFLDCFKRIIA